MTYTDIMRDGIRRKYTVLRYIYSQMMQTSMEGGQFYRPVFYEYPEDLNTYTAINLNYFIGTSLKASMLSNDTNVN
jgi:alpha-glucosidase (family GH31 glycosyl hydrolase)